VIKLEIDSSGYDLDDDLRQRIEDKFGGLDTCLDSLATGHVTVSWDGGKGEETAVRAQVRGPGHHFEASDSDRDPTTAVDKTHHQLETQIRREHGKEISERDPR
jgi:ribosomal subunit interface protein